MNPAPTVEIRFTEDGYCINGVFHLKAQVVDVPAVIVEKVKLHEQENSTD